MRLFAGLPVGGDAAAELERLLGELRQMAWPVRWVRGDGLHVTVKFLGDVGADLVPAISETLGVASRDTPALPFAPGDLGAFPSLERPRVLWAGYESEAAMELLVHRVEQGTEALGFPVEGRPFRPHVTLGRLRQGASLPAGAAGRLEERTLEGAFVADRLVLFESRPGSQGSMYVPVETFRLGT